MENGDILPRFICGLKTKTGEYYKSRNETLCSLYYIPGIGGEEEKTLIASQRRWRRRKRRRREKKEEEKA